MSIDLVSLSSAVEAELGVVSELFDGSFIVRALNEGQRRYQPDLLRPSLATITIAAGATEYTLPDDFVRIDKMLADYGTDLPPESFQVHGKQLIFSCPLRNAFSGRLLYFAVWPDVTDESACELPPAAADGLISYALYRCYKRIASNRVDYRTYSTMVANQASVADVEAMAQTYLDDWQAAGESAIVLPEPSA